MNWKNVREDAKPTMQQLYTVMVSAFENGKKTEEHKTQIKAFKERLRNIGVLSLPFSLNLKKFKP